MEERNWKYKITGGWPTLIVASIMLAIFTGLTVWLYNTRNRAFIGGLIVTACMAIGFILSVCSVLFFKVFVDKDGFFARPHQATGGTIATAISAICGSVPAERRTHASRPTATLKR